MISAKAHIGEREVDRLDGHPGARVERAGDAESDRVDLPADGGADLFDGVRDEPDELHLIQAEHRAVGTVMDRQISVQRAGQQLGSAEIDADDASLGHAGHITAPPPWPTTTTAPTPPTAPARAS